jgi:hypothetical protein
MNGIYDALIERANQHIARDRGIRDGTLLADDGRLWFDFRCFYSDRVLEVSFWTEDPRYSKNLSLLSNKGVDKICSPLEIFPGIPLDAYKSMDFDVGLNEGEPGDILAFRTDGRAITNKCPYGPSDQEKYYKRLEIISDPLEAVDLAFEALTN